MGKKVKKEVEPPPKDVFDPLSIESKKAETAVLMLQSPEEEILAKSCDALYKFAQKGDENKITLLGLGAVESLSKLISHEDKIVRRNATMVCGIMAAHNEVRRLMQTLDLIPPLIARLAPEEEVVIHEFATLCLAHMAHEYTSKVRIFEVNGLEHLIRLLSSPDPDVKKNSVECIYLLAQDFQSRSAVCDQNAIPPLLELLKSDYPVIQHLSLKALGTISCEAECRLALKESQALDHLLKILEAKELNDLHVEALLIIANCLEDADTVQLLQQSGGLKKILTFAETSPLPDVQRNAAKAIAMSAHNAENRKFFHEQEAEKTLVELLGSDNNGVKVAALQAISMLCENLASKDVFSKNGILQIINLLSKDNADVQEAAVFALANLITGCPNNPGLLGRGHTLFLLVLVEADGIDALVNLLTDKREGVIANTCTVLTNMAAQESLRLAMQSHGVMPALVATLQSASNLVLRKAIITVASLGCDAEARTEFRIADGLVQLVKLLSSNHDEVRRNACWAIAVFANDEATASELYRLGAFDILQEMNLSTSRRNNFSELAENKMLDNNLSLKYNQKGHLSYTNLIEDGFYDHGQLKSGAKLPSLEELSKQTLNQNRAVIVINTKLPELPTPSPPAVEEKPELNLGRSSSSLSRSASREKGGRNIPSPVEDKQDLSSGRSPSLSRSGHKEKSSSKMKNKVKKEEEKMKEEEELSPVKTQEEPVPPQITQWFPPCDQDLIDYLSDVTRTILPLPHPREQVVALAQFVAGKMGGPIAKDRLHEFSWELHVGEIKYELKSNVIPIGKIKKGIFYHRALLFKALADRIGVVCNLTRGDYGRAWNEVKILNDSNRAGTKAQPETNVVDLMYEPGRLMKHGSVEADHYQHI
ncbi:armadillo repeat-containing protein 3 isoform X2 [Hyla sarda]|uniref:armadillo repeat-containing protein 3 isoform X2 n=1 Tax=Hyla sarda TaxID=327740 RepID=UPI0024C210E5|nr:armadillo repeat-containing protein 3 isoform X2 [Hyla sarda]